MVKKQTSFTIDEETIKKIKSQSQKEDRSESYIVNKILNEHYTKKKNG